MGFLGLRKRGRGRGGVRESLIPCVFWVNLFFVLITSRNAMKHMILSLKMKGDVISDHFLMVPKRFWIQSVLGLTAGGPES